MKKISLLGASGSIGIQTVDVCLEHPDKFQIKALSVGQNINQCRIILDKLKGVELVCISDENDAKILQKEYPEIKIVFGDQGLIEVATTTSTDILVNAVVGYVGLVPTIEAIKSRKDIALANKETLVVAGEVVTQLCKEMKVKLLPIDSEHSAIFQALQGNELSDVKRLIITASGGSFRELNRSQLKDVTLQDALKHPNWAMGSKITIDSATMMNKGLEVIEAHWLFGFDYDQIDVILHPQSIIHSMVEYHDKAVIAQLGTADMRHPIQYALSYPRRYSHESESLDFVKLHTLTFKEMDFERFPLLKLAYDVGRKKGNLAAVMNGANEMANQLFREEKISFLKIEELVIEACEKCEYKKNVTLNDCLQANEWGKNYVLERIK